MVSYASVMTGKRVKGERVTGRLLIYVVGPTPHVHNRPLGHGVRVNSDFPSVVRHEQNTSARACENELSYEIDCVLLVSLLRYHSLSVAPSRYRQVVAKWEARSGGERYSIKIRNGTLFLADIIYRVGVCMLYVVCAHSGAFQEWNVGIWFRPLLVYLRKSPGVSALH